MASQSDFSFRHDLLMPSRAAMDLARRIDRVSEDVQTYIKAILGAAEQRHDLRQ